MATQELKFKTQGEQRQAEANGGEQEDLGLEVVDTSALDTTQLDAKLLNAIDGKEGEVEQSEMEFEPEMDGDLVDDSKEMIIWDISAEEVLWPILEESYEQEKEQEKHKWIKSNKDEHITQQHWSTEALKHWSTDSWLEEVFVEKVETSQNENSPYELSDDFENPTENKHSDHNDQENEAVAHNMWGGSKSLSLPNDIQLIKKLQMIIKTHSWDTELKIWSMSIWVDKTGEQKVIELLSE